MKEIWKSIKGFEDYYEASNFGRIRSKERKSKCLANGKYPCIKTLKAKILKPRIWNKRNQVALSIDGKRTDFWAHRIIAETWIPNPQNLKEINHKNADPLDNRISNLEWCTRLENMQHAKRNGLMNPPKGEAHYKSKLTNKDVIKIRKRYKDGESQISISKYFGVIPQTISEICRGNIWKHI